MPKIREMAGQFAREHVKYLIYVAIAVGGTTAIFFRSQAAQDHDRGSVKGRVSCTETEIKAIKDSHTDTKKEIAKQREEISKTREEMVKIAESQRAMSREQRSLSEVQRTMDTKMDDLKTILIRMERDRNP